METKPLDLTGQDPHLHSGGELRGTAPGERVTVKKGTSQLCGLGDFVGVFLPLSELL